MKSIRRFAAALVALVALTAPALAERTAPSPEVQATYKDIEATLGMVPSFFKQVPPEALPGAWEEFKTLQLAPDTAIPNKYKELIGLAVAAQIPCRYCIYFHTQVARAQGATDRELSEAVLMAGLTRHWSTVLNGMQVDEDAFKKDVARALEFVKSGRSKPGPDFTDAAGAYKDIELTLGSVPSFFRLFPSRSIAGAWRAYKSLELNPKTAIPGKYKELTGLAVAAQIPCRYCIYFHTQVAKLNGATDAEISEAVALAGNVRQWSTFLNGMQIDEAQFRKELDTILKPKKTASR